MSEEPKPPPGYSAFKALLEKLVKVPRKEIEEQEQEYQREREAMRKKA